MLSSLTGGNFSSSSNVFGVEVTKLMTGVLLCVVSVTAARAAPGDTFQPFVSLGYSHDDNLFRLDENILGFTGPRGDSMRQAQIGLTYTQPIGRQMLTAVAKVSRVNFDHYSNLDYHGKNFNADLAYQLGNHVSGKVGGAYIQSLTSFRDANSTDRNLRTQNNGFAEINWRLHPSWQVHGGYTQDKFSYDLYSQRFSNRTEDAAEAGFDFLAASGSRFGLVARNLKGKFAIPRSVGGVQIDEGYTQDELKARVNWQISGVTNLQAFAGWARRNHHYRASRDSSGLNGRVDFVWAPLSRLRLTAAGWREYAAVENDLVNSSLSRGGSIGAIWNLTGKINLNGQLRRDRREFEQLPGLPLRIGSSDSTRYATLGATYDVATYAQINLSTFQERRSGSLLVGTSSYSAKGASINITAQF